MSAPTWTSTDPGERGPSLTGVAVAVAAKASVAEVDGDAGGSAPHPARSITATASVATSRSAMVQGPSGFTHWARGRQPTIASAAIPSHEVASAPRPGNVGPD